eukprot:scaffold61460_cov34-Tisochrysis_lutea.AAC.5
MAVCSRENLACMRLAAWFTAVSAVEILAPLDEFDGGLNIDILHPSKQRGTAQRAVGEARVDLSPLVACECSVLLLQRGDVSHHTGLVEVVKRVEECKDLYCRECVEDVRIVPQVARKASVAPLAREHKADDLLTLQLIELREEVEGAGAPVDAGHAKVL